MSWKTTAMEAITYLAVLGMAMGGGSGKSPAAMALVGTWRVQLSQEVKDASRKMGMPEPQAQFVFNGDNTFIYTSSSGGFAKTISGNYDVSDHAVRLLPSGNEWPSPPLAQLRQGEHELNVNGLVYRKSEALSSLAGTWTLHNGPSEDKSVKILFKPNGTFEFSGQFATSKGKYSVEGNMLTLNWTHIDNEEVAPGSVHKTVVLSDDGSFFIDSYHYQRS